MKQGMPAKCSTQLFLIGIFNQPTLQFEEIKLYGITYTWNLKNNTNECICKTESDSHIKKTNL